MVALTIRLTAVAISGVHPVGDWGKATGAGDASARFTIAKRETRESFMLGALSRVSESTMLAIRLVGRRGTVKVRWARKDMIRGTKVISKA